MEKFIDVFYLPDVDPETPYRCFVWQRGAIGDMTRESDLAAVVKWCRNLALPARVYDAQIREELRLQGIDVTISARQSQAEPGEPDARSGTRDLLTARVHAHTPLVGND